MSDVASFSEEWNEAVRQLRVRHLVEHGKGCCWPMWADGARPNFHFCGAVKDGPLSSYCAQHAQKATASKDAPEAREGLSASVDVPPPNLPAVAKSAAGRSLGGSLSLASEFPPVRQSAVNEFAPVVNK